MYEPKDGSKELDVQRFAHLNFLVFIASIVGFFIGAVITWILAPEVGGEYWPYIRVGTSLLIGLTVTGTISVVGYVWVAKQMMGYKLIG